jgi:hypothetical protein
MIFKIKNKKIEIVFYYLLFIIYYLLFIIYYLISMNSLEQLKTPVIILNNAKIDIDEISNLISNLNIDLYNDNWDNSSASRFQTGC